MTDASGRGRALRPVLLLLLVTVLLPTAGVLWFMNAAVRNERLAVRQKLVQAYRPRLAKAARQLDDHWQAKMSALSGSDSALSAPARFADLVITEVCDSAVLYGPDGRLLYPAVSPAAGADSLSGEPAVALAHEFESGHPGVAAVAYGELAAGAEDEHFAAQCLRAEARCLVKAGRANEAVTVLAVDLSDPRFRGALDRQGRAVVPAARLRALELMADAEHPLFARTLEALSERLRDYDGPDIPSSQRRFLMRRVLEIAPDIRPFRTMRAATLAADYLAAGGSRPEPGSLTPAPLPNLWRMSSADGAVVALFRQARVVGEMRALLKAEAPANGDRMELELPAAEHDEAAPFLAIEAGRHLPDWQLALYLDGPNPFDAAAERQVAAYLWTGFLVIATIAVFALLAAHLVGRQIRLTHLKNDFIATVTHELRTPLASMRVLVDTLLEGRQRDEQQAREYLQLVARENERLSRLIDNFLTFSRMERNKQAFEFADVRIRDIVDTAIDAVRERFDAAGCRFGVDVAPDLPPVSGDSDALVTVVLNLLDNAYKYTGKDKQIALWAFADDGTVCVAVEDNGIGLSRRAARKVFDRFYQVDRSLSRSAGGCGLGLSIVRFIVDAHGGSVDVRSKPGEGSTFTVRLPAKE